MSLLEKIGDDLLISGKGWFCKHSLRGIEVAPKYKKLLGNRNGPFGG